MATADLLSCETATRISFLGFDAALQSGPDNSDGLRNLRKQTVHDFAVRQIARFANHQHPSVYDQYADVLDWATDAALL